GGGRSVGERGGRCGEYIARRASGGVGGSCGGVTARKQKNGCPPVRVLRKSTAASANCSLENFSATRLSTTRPSRTSATGTFVWSAMPPKNTERPRGKARTNDASPLCHLPVANAS